MAAEGSQFGHSIVDLGRIWGCKKRFMKLKFAYKNVAYHILGARMAAEGYQFGHRIVDLARIWGWEKRFMSDPMW